MNKHVRQRISLIALIVTLSSFPVAPILADKGEAGEPHASVSLPRRENTHNKWDWAVPSIRLAAASPEVLSPEHPLSGEGQPGQMPPAEEPSQDALSERQQSGDKTVPANPTPGQTPAASGDESQTKLAVAGTVDIGGGNSIAVQDVALLPGNDGNIVAFTLNITNGGNKDLQFIDYWVRLKSKSGAQFFVSLLPQDKDKNRIPAGTSQEIHFYSKVSGNIRLDDLEFKIIKWDFSQPDFERELGTVSITDRYSYVTPPSAKKTVSVSGIPMRTGITKVAMSRNNQYVLPTIYFEWENAGARSVTFPDYQYHIRTKEGLLYPLQVSGLAKDTSVHPRFKKEIRLKGSLPLDLDLGRLELVITYHDETAKVTLPVAFYELPAPDSATDTDVVQAGKVKTLEIEENTLETSVKKLITKTSDKFNQNIIEFVMKNTGTTPIKVPKYRFALKTADGLTYPATAEKVDELTINPQVSEEIQLKVPVPVGINTEHSTLELFSPPDEEDSDSEGVLLAEYDLPLANQSNAVAGNTGEFSNDAGTYGVRFQSVQRLPWQDQDIISASLTLSNLSGKTLPVPALTGKFVLDDSIDIPFKVSQADKVIGIQKGSEIHLDLYAKIPYTYQYSKMNIVLEEKVDDETSYPLLEFAHDASTMTPRFISEGDSYLLKGIGRNASLAVTDARSYEGVDGDLINVLLNVQNLEKRFVNVPKLVAYFQTKDGSVYPATVSELKNKLGPNSVAALNVSGTLPSETKTDELRLLVGEGVMGENSGDDPVQGAVAYVNAVSFAVPAEKEPKTHFEQLDLYPYRVSLSNFKTELLQATETGGGKFTIKFDYKLSKSLLAEDTENEHKLVIELTDRNNDMSYTTVLELGTEDGLKVGEGTKEILITDETIVLRMPYLDRFEINVYDEFKGLKKKLASRSFSWF